MREGLRGGYAHCFEVALTPALDLRLVSCDNSLFPVKMILMMLLGVLLLTVFLALRRC
jgi:hypothetical protein